jgi:mandelate racemase
MSITSDPIIKNISVRAVCVPMTQPHQTAGGTITESPLILTDIVTDDGTVGHSIVFAYNLMALKPIADLVRNLEPLLIGAALAPGKIEQILGARFRLLGTQGLVGIALSAIDMAVWDALARRHETSLVRLLGGIEKPVQAYGSVGYGGAKGSADGAEAWAKRGFKGVKAKIGYPTVREDVEVIRAIRHAVGSDVAIMVDYNQCLTPTDAIQRLRVLDAEGLTWVEEPTLAHDFTGHAEIARQTETPIQCGENWWGVLDMQHAIDAGASDYIMPDVMKIGGVSGWMRAAAIAQVRGIRLSNHFWPELSTQLLCATPTAHWLEYADWWNPILADPLEISDGYATVNGVLGSGIEWNESAVKRFLV